MVSPLKCMFDYPRIHSLLLVSYFSLNLHMTQHSRLKSLCFVIVGPSGNKPATLLKEKDLETGLSWRPEPCSLAEESGATPV